MTCSEFYAKTKSMINPTGLITNANGSVKNVYFGSAHPVVFHNQWDANNLDLLMNLQNLNSWANSELYIAAHYFTASNGAIYVSLSATSDPDYSKDVTDVQLTATNIEVQGFPR